MARFALGGISILHLVGYRCWDTRLPYPYSMRYQGCDIGITILACDVKKFVLTGILVLRNRYQPRYDL